MPASEKPTQFQTSGRVRAQSLTADLWRYRGGAKKAYTRGRTIPRSSPTRVVAEEKFRDRATATP